MKPHPPDVRGGVSEVSGAKAWRTSAVQSGVRRLEMSRVQAFQGSEGSELLRVCGCEGAGVQALQPTAEGHDAVF